MTPGPSPSLRMPAFLHGPFMSVARKASKEGHRWGEQYRQDGTFPASRELLEVHPGEPVITHEVADFHRERPAWRVYLASRVVSGLMESLDYPSGLQVRNHYEASFRETAWGALHLTVEPNGPRSAARIADGLRAVLHFWESLQAARYLFKKQGEQLTLEELMLAACDWALDAWSPMGDSPVRARVELAAERMARATKEDCMQAILREMPRVFEHARGLKHRSVLADPVLVRERLEMLPPEAFARVSAACTSDLLGMLYAWDREMEKQ